MSLGFVFQLMQALKPLCDPVQRSCAEEDKGQSQYLNMLNLEQTDPAAYLEESDTVNCYQKPYADKELQLFFRFFVHVSPLLNPIIILSGLATHHKELFP